MINQRNLKTTLLLLAPSLALVIFGELWKAPVPETHYEVVWTDGGNGSGYNVAVWQRNKDVHTLSVTAKKIVLETIEQRRKAKRPMFTFMQIFFHFNKPEPSKALNGEHRFGWQWEGIELEY